MLRCIGCDGRGELAVAAVEKPIPDEGGYNEQGAVVDMSGEKVETKGRILGVNCMRSHNGSEKD